MKFFNSFTLLFLSFVLFSQTNPKMDTIYYSTDTRFEYLAPNVEVGDKSVFQLTRIDISINDGDTIRDARKNGVFSYEIIGKGETFYLAEIILDSILWKDLLFDNNQPVIHWRPKKVSNLIYQINNKGDYFKIYNCEEVYDFVLPFVNQKMDFYKGHEDEKWMMRYLNALPEKLKDCEYLGKSIFNDLIFIHQLYGMPLPVKDTLKYELRPTTIEDDMDFSVYYKIIKENLPNKTVKFSFGEDDNKGKMAMDHFSDAMLKMFSKMDSTLATEEIINKNTQTDYLIFDRKNFPTEVFREIKNYRKTKSGEKQGYFLYKIKKID